MTIEDILIYKPIFSDRSKRHVELLRTAALPRALICVHISFQQDTTCIMIDGGHGLRCFIIHWTV